jgi:hypothetical protein
VNHGASCAFLETGLTHDELGASQLGRAWTGPW